MFDGTERDCLDATHHGPPPLPSPATSHKTSLSIPSDETDLRTRLAQLEATVATLQQQLTQLALALLQARALPEETLSPAPAPQSQPTGEQRKKAAFQEVEDDHQSKAGSYQEPLAHAAEQRIGKKPPLLTSPNNDGTYALSGPTLGPIVIQPDSQEWFAWLASLPSFHFIGPSGRLSACRGYDHGPTRTWYAYRTSRGRFHKRYLGTTDQLTLARLEDMAASLQSSIDATVSEGETPGSSS